MTVFYSYSHAAYEQHPTLQAYVAPILLIITNDITAKYYKIF